MGIDEFTLDEKYILRYAIEQMMDRKVRDKKYCCNFHAKYTLKEMKTVWTKVLNLIDNHNRILA